MEMKLGLKTLLLLGPLLPRTSAAAAALDLDFQDAGHTFFSDHFVRIVDENLIHVHKLCLHGGHDGLMVPRVDAAERVLKKRFPLDLPPASRPSTFQQITRNESRSLFRGNKSVPLKVRAIQSLGSGRVTLPVR